MTAPRPIARRGHRLLLALCSAVGVCGLRAQPTPSDRLIDSVWAREAPATSLALALQRLRTNPADRAALWRAARAEVTAGILSHDPQPIKAAMYQRAADFARRATLAGPPDATSQYWLAAALGRHALIADLREGARLADAARAAVLTALALDSMHPGAHAALGRMHAEARNLPTPTRWVAAHLLRVNAIRQASWADAERELRRAITLDPGGIPQRLDLALTLARTARWAESGAVLADARRLPIRSPADSALLLETGGKIVTLRRRAGLP